MIILKLRSEIQPLVDQEEDHTATSPSTDPFSANRPHKTAA